MRAGCHLRRLRQFAARAVDVATHQHQFRAIEQDDVLGAQCAAAGNRPRRREASLSMLVAKVVIKELLDALDCALPAPSRSTAAAG